MKNPITTIKTKINLGRAVKAATQVQQGEGFVPIPDWQKFIELSSLHYPVTDGLDPVKVHYQKQRQVEMIINNTLIGVAAGETAKVEEALEFLSGFYGYPNASRLGGVPEKLADAMRHHNLRSEDGEVKIPESVIAKAEALVAEQQTWPNNVRSAKLEEARRSLHTRYPSDFLNMVLNRNHAPNEAKALCEWF